MKPGITLKRINELELSEIGLGTWAIGGPWKFGWGKQDSRESEKTILTALEQGINWIDTAPAYGLGHAEELIGEMIRNRLVNPEKTRIATKCGIVWDSSQKVSFNIHPQSIREECEKSLKRLQIESIDLYQIHWPDQKTPIRESWAEMIKLKETGKVKNIGVCNFNLNLLKKCYSMGDLATLQSCYNMLTPDLEKEIIPWCQSHGVGILAYSPLQSGLLSGNFSREYLQFLPDDDWRKRNPLFKDPALSRSLDFIDSIKPLTEKYRVSLAALAVAWTLTHPAVSCSISGARHIQQANGITSGAGWKLSPDDMKEIAAQYKKFFINV